MRHPLQFRTSPAEVPCADAMARRVLRGGMALDHDPALPVIPVSDGKDDCGLLLGWPVDVASEQLLDGDAVLPRMAGESLDAWVERTIYALAGSWMFVLDHAEAARIYLDANGTLSLVYSPDLRQAAATADLLLGADYDLRLRHDLIDAFSAKGDGWFSAGMTAHDGVERLMPNHFLDLSDFTVARHWPNALPAYSDDADALADALASEVRSVVTALRKVRPVAMTLTGGNEARALMACVGDQRGGLRFVTVAMPYAQLDLHLARRLAKTHGLDHLVLPSVAADDAEQDLWLRRAGHSVGGVNKRFHPSVRPLADHFLVGGLGGEVGRGFLWYDGLQADSEVTAQGLLTRLKLPHQPLLVERVERWLADLPAGFDAYQVHDLAYVELRMGTWAYAQAWTNPDERMMQPLTSRAQFLRMWSAAPQHRRQTGLIRRVVLRAWPELLDIPINAYGNWRDRVRPLERMIRRPGAAWRKLRQILGSRAIRRSAASPAGQKPLEQKTT